MEGPTENVKDENVEKGTDDGAKMTDTTPPVENNADLFVDKILTFNTRHVSIRAGNEFSCGLMNLNRLYTDETIQSIKYMSPDELVSTKYRISGFS